MGVQGLIPFLQKLCPAVLKKLPNRLQDIQGKRIVIDGTLITQRLHFAQGPGTNRHILGWYKIAKELSDSNVSAICVFDGKSRNLAKAREVKRRRELRQLTAARGSIENDRLQRLNELKVITKDFQSLDEDEKRSVVAHLSDVSLTPEKSATEEEDRVDRVMTKAQNQLTIDEGKVWQKIATLMSMPVVLPVAAPAFLFSTINDIHALVDKSHHISMSFQRRTDIPTARSYEESKEILQAMGIPCIDATDATEAEALASAMVHQGLADFVATEDTDVLVYEVPMIKNITSRSEPLVIVSGAEVRSALDLDRDSFIDFALLLGTDFSQRIANVGPKRAYKFIQDHGSIERIIELETKYEPKLSREAYLAEVEIARLVFKTLPVVPSSETLKATPKDDTEVTRVLQKYGVNPALGEAAGDPHALLDGNYFGDNPTAT